MNRQVLSVLPRLLGTLSVFALALPAVAQDFNIDINASLGVPAPIYAGAEAQAGFWNGVSATPSGPISLATLAGSASLVTIETSGGSAFAFNNALTNGNDNFLFDDLQSFNQATIWTLRGLETGTYDVTIFAWAPDFPNDQTEVELLGSGAGPQPVGGGNWPGNVSPGVTHVVQTASVYPGGALAVQASPLTANFGSLNGFQVRKVSDGTGDEAYCYGNGGITAACTPCPCGNNAPAGFLGGCLNQDGRSAQLVAQGVASVSGDTLRIEMRGGTSNSFAILSSGAGRLPSGAANPCFGLDSGISNSQLDGLRCIGAGVLRHGTRPVDVNGDVGVTTNGWGPPNGPPGGLIAANAFTAGQIRHFQIFYRVNPAFSCGTGQNTTDALTLTIRP